jgi:hypothetical protein
MPLRYEFPPTLAGSHGMRCDIASLMQDRDLVAVFGIVVAGLLISFTLILLDPASDEAWLTIQFVLRQIMND